MGTESIKIYDESWDINLEGKSQLPLQWLYASNTSGPGCSEV